MATALSRILRKPTRWAAKMPASTGRAPRGARCAKNVSGSRLSRLMFSRCSPASLSACACSASRMPLVVSAMSRMPGTGCELGDQQRQVVPHQRFAAGEPNLVDAQPGHDAHEPLDFLEREQLMARLELHVLGRHAIEAANVAAIGDADPQVRVHAAEGVDQWCGNGGRRDRSVTIASAHDRALPGWIGTSFGLARTFQSRMDPLARAVGPVFFLPDRHDLFERVDQPLAGLERRAARCGRADGHGHAGFADCHVAHAMHDRAVHQRPALGGPRLRARPASPGPCRRNTRSRATRSRARRSTAASCPETAPPRRPRARRPGPSTACVSIGVGDEFDHAKASHATIPRPYDCSAQIHSILR